MYTSKYLNNFALSCLSGLLLTLSFPHTGGLNLLSFVGLIPLLVVEDKCYQANSKGIKVFLLAYLAFFIFNLGTTWWIAFADFYGAVLAVVANSLVMALFFTLFHFVRKHVGSKQGYFSLLFLWVSFEYMHYHWELSWPWLNFGNFFANAPVLVQWYEYTGVLGGTLWVLILNVLIFKIYRDTFHYKIPLNEQQLYSGITLLIFASPIAFSIAKYYTYTEKNNPIEVIVTQPNIDPYTEKFGHNSLPVKAQLDRFLSIANSLVTPETDFVLAPETAIPYEIAEEKFASTDIYNYLLDEVKGWKGANLYVGASTTKYYEKKHSPASRQLQNGGFYESYNTSLLISNRQPVNFVHKSKLVLGVEIIPFARIFPWLESLALNMGGSSGSLGVSNKPKVLGNDSVKFIPIVCYESIYGAYLGQFAKIGGQVIFIITNDGWWKNTPGYKQHFDFARLRAIETRRSVARSANTGISGFINQRGDVIIQSKWDEQIALKSKINLNDKITFYAQFGDWIGYSCTLPAIFLVLVAFLGYFKKRFKQK